ncbi:LamG domain-containing protein [Pontiellaceae bacterium B12219]|nr:LamG domain-containing protein [Pontiellaceae bacterium B12219]
MKIRIIKTARLLVILVSSFVIVASAQAALVGEWAFDSRTFENSGTAGPVHDGTFVTDNTDCFSTDTVTGIGYSLRIKSIADDDFTGGGDVLLINNSKSTDGGYIPTFDGSAFTVSMWIKVEDASWFAWDEFAGKGNESAGAGWSLRSQKENRIWFTEYAAGGALAGGLPNAFDGSWHLITATYDASDSTKMKIYLDGVLSKQVGNSISDASFFSLAFGARENGSRGENILIDSIQYYDTALSASEVAALVQEPVALVPEPKTLGLILSFLGENYFSFDALYKS